MAIFSAEVEGLTALLKDMQRLPNEAAAELIPASVKCGNAIKELAVSRVPISKYGKGYYGIGKNKGKTDWNHEPGLLRKSIKVKKPTKAKVKKSNITTTVGFDKGAAYGVPLELGHKIVFYGRAMGGRVKERPFLRSSADDKKQMVIDENIKAINETLNKFGRKG